MNAETEGDAESPKRRGRIPQSAWPRILERYKAGATLSAIAREFDCTPSAISYIVRKAEAAGLTREGEETAETAATPAQAPAPPEPTPPPAPPVAETPRPRRAPRVAEPLPAAEAPAAEAEPVVPVATVAAATPAPVADLTPVTAVEPPAAEPPAADGLRESPFHHESGRQGEAPRRFEGRENRPPREVREGRDMRESRPERAEQFGQDRRAERERGDRERGEFRGEPRQDRGPQQGDRRQQQGHVRFPQGGQPGPQRDRFGDRPPRDRLEVRPPRGEFDRDRNNTAGEGRSGERHVPDYQPSEGPSEVVYPYRQQQRNPARLEASETPTIPADERMDAAAKACAEAYKSWKEQTGGGVQGLTDALHELRKVIARMEIEISASRKEEQRAIPFPAYRTNLPPPQQSRG